MKNRIMKLMLVTAMIFPLLTKGGVALLTVISDSTRQFAPYIKDGIFNWNEAESIYYAPIVNGLLGEKKLLTTNGDYAVSSKGIIVYPSNGKILAKNTITGEDYLVTDNGKYPSNDGSKVAWTRYNKIYYRDIESDKPEIVVDRVWGDQDYDPVIKGNSIYFLRAFDGGSVCYTRLGEKEQHVIHRARYKNGYEERTENLNVSDSGIVSWYSSHFGIMIYQNGAVSVLGFVGFCPVLTDNALFWITYRERAPGIYKKNLGSDEGEELLYPLPYQRHIASLTADNNEVGWVEVNYGIVDNSAINWLTLSPPPTPPITPPIALRIEKTADTVMLRWLITSPPFHLESRLGFSRSMLSGGGSPSWRAVLETPTNNGQEFVVTLPRRQNTEFFRLKQ